MKLCTNNKTRSCNKKGSITTNLIPFTTHLIKSEDSLESLETSIVCKLVKLNERRCVSNLDPFVIQSPSNRVSLFVHISVHIFMGTTNPSLVHFDLNPHSPFHQSFLQPLICPGLERLVPFLKLTTTIQVTLRQFLKDS